MKIHFPRNTLAQAGKDQRQRVRAAIPTAFAQDAFEAASTAWRVLAQQLRRKVQKRAERMDDAQADVLAYRNVPRAHRTQSDTTNLLEPRNVAVQRRTGVAGIFPSWAAVQRPVDVLRLEQNDERSL